ncbi:hypothetical protein F5Y04DRAFT_282138 [Hypomontagnella monticulosa]|nr:hypothetical protein F5Y04DRAFT_282138 [Hypomontagnella monticulosa]
MAPRNPTRGARLPSPQASGFLREDNSYTSIEAGCMLSPRRTTRSIQAFVHRLGSWLRLQRKSNRSSPDKGDIMPATPRGSNVENVVLEEISKIQRPGNNHTASGVTKVSVRRHDLDCRQLDSRYRPTTLNHKNIGEELNHPGNPPAMHRHRSSACTPSLGHPSHKPYLSSPEVDISRNHEHGKPLPVPAPATLLTIDPDASGPMGTFGAAEERARTLRILESKDRQTVERSCSPGTARRRRRSYQLATDPRIDPEQYVEFRQFLEQEIATDLAVRLKMWKSLTRDLENRSGFDIRSDPTAKLPMPETTCPPTGHMRRVHQNASSRSPGDNRGPVRYAAMNHIVGRQINRGRRHNRMDREKLAELTSNQPTKIHGTKSGYQGDDYPPVLKNNKRGRPRPSATYPGRNPSAGINSNETFSRQQGDVQERLNSLHQDMRPKPPSGKRCICTSSSFTQVIIQYIRPEMPVSIYDDTGCGSSRVGS